MNQTFQPGGWKRWNEARSGTWFYEIMAMICPRPRFTVRSLMFLVMVVATLLSMAPRGKEWGLRAKEEIRARRAIVEEIDSFMSNYNIEIDNKSRRIALSSQQSAKDPRHDRWVREVAEARSSVARFHGDLAKYQRLAAYPWLPFPEKGYQRFYLDEIDMDRLYRTSEWRAALLWSSAGALISVLIVLVPLFLLEGIARRFRSAPQIRTRPTEIDGTPEV